MRFWTVAAVLSALATTFAGGGVARAAPSPFAWAPLHTPAVASGRQSGARFNLLGLTEIEVEVDDLYDAANRQALAMAEQRLARVPGVRAVYGPASLLDITVDGSGKTSARPVLARGTSESEGEAARQRVVRRADALGWFLTENGRRVRFLVDAPDWDRTAPALAEALAGSGLELLPSAGGGLEAKPLWPDPRRHRARLLPLGYAVVWTFFLMVAAWRAHFPLGRRRIVRALAAAAGAGAPFALMPIAGIRLIGVLAALGAGGTVFFFPWRQGTGPITRPRFFRVALLAAAALTLEVAALSPRLRVGTRQWSAAPMFFVSVHGDLDEPVVLREVRRFADFLRAQPGVANAWSVADLFLGVTFEGAEASGIPDDPEVLRRILVQGRSDPAVRLELSADHREALIGVRFDDDPTVDRLAIVARADRYITRELRRSQARIELGAAATTPGARLVGAGILAGDTRDRVLRICARSGRTLSRAEALSVERVARAATLIPAADPARLQAELADTVRDFTAHHPFPLAPTEVQRLISAAVSGATGPNPEELRLAVASAYGERLQEPVLTATASSLAKRLSAVRRRHTARLDFKEMLYGADLPTEGVLADEVRSATLEASGPIAGVPVVAGTAGAFVLDAQPIGGAPNDQMLSELWNRALRAGVVAAAGAIAILLVVVGGPRGLFSLPLALAPLAAAVAPSAILREPIGLPTISFLAGALAGGALLAMIVTPGRDEPARRSR